MVLSSKITKRMSNKTIISDQIVRRSTSFMNQTTPSAMLGATRLAVVKLHILLCTPSGNVVLEPRRHPCSCYAATEIV